MIVNLHWTFTREDSKVRVSDLGRHQTTKGVPTRQGRIGGMGLPKPIFTRVIMRDGRLFPLLPENGEVHLSLEGGLSNEFKFKNTATNDQLSSLANELRSLLHTHKNIEIISDNLTNFDIELWTKAIGLTK